MRDPRFAASLAMPASAPPLALAGMTLAGVGAYQTGKEQQLANEFEDVDTTAGKFFAGLGVRLGR